MQPINGARLPLLLRIGVYQDGPFLLVRTPEGVRIAPDPVDAPFIRFVSEVAGQFDSFAIFARLEEGDADADARLLLPPEVRVVRLPPYGSLLALGAVARATGRTLRAFWRGLDEVDYVWAFGPHPFQLLLVALARLRGRRVALGVRQDTPAYFRARLPSRRWRPVIAAVDAMDALHRLVARRIPATVVGEANAATYASPRGRVLAMAPSLMRAADVVAAAPERDWSGTIELLTVGRVDAEKNPFLLVDAIAELERMRPGRYRLTWVGTGPMMDAVRARAVERGIAERFRLAGYVPFGPELLAHYRGAHLFVHVSLTEGVPQVLVEALASGTPVVATEVGGVGPALDGGRAGLLVPPSDITALVRALTRLSDDPELRQRVVEHGLDLARARTLEAEAARVAAFLRDRALG
jgi:glycosyltransferase involved in cell wall biosynthesis